MFDFNKDRDLSEKEHDDNMKVAELISNYYEEIVKVKNEEDLKDLLFDMFVDAETLTIKTMLENEIEDKQHLFDMLFSFPKPKTKTKFDIKNVEFGAVEDSRKEGSLLDDYDEFINNLKKQEDKSFKTNDSDGSLRDFFNRM